MNIGDYVRTKKGIGKIKQFLGQNNNINYYEVDKNGTHQPLDCFIEIVFENEIIKSSPNIIDLIEVGDYVNGEQITSIGDDDNINNEKLLYYYIPSDWGEDCFREKDIKSIVTKEQFESMEYRIGE